MRELFHGLTVDDSQVEREARDDRFGRCKDERALECLSVERALPSERNLVRRPVPLVARSASERAGLMVKDDGGHGLAHEKRAREGDEETDNGEDPVRPSPVVLLSQGSSDERS